MHACIAFQNGKAVDAYLHGNQLRATCMLGPFTPNGGRDVFINNYYDNSKEQM